MKNATKKIYRMFLKNWKKFGLFSVNYTRRENFGLENAAMGLRNALRGRNSTHSPWPVWQVSPALCLKSNSWIQTEQENWR